MRADEGHRLPSDFALLCGGVESGRLQVLDELGQSRAVPDGLTGLGSQADHEDAALFEDSGQLAKTVLLRAPEAECVKRESSGEAVVGERQTLGSREAKVAAALEHSQPVSLRCLKEHHLRWVNPGKARFRIADQEMLE
jgi:hypothetical protein